MPVFDFHCHPTLKPLFVKKGDEPSPWAYLNVKYKVGKVLGNEVKLSINKLVNEVLNSQSNFSQLCGRVNLIGLILHAPESDIGRGLLERKMVSQEKLDLLNAAKLRMVRNGDHYYSWLLQETAHLQQHLLPPANTTGLPAGAQVKLLRTAADFNEQDLATVHCFLVVEGLHCFFNNPDSATAMEEFYRNFHEFTNDHKVFAVNITHLQDMPFANHASGMQFLNEGYFYPVKKGLSDRGKEVVEQLHSKGILIDIKHLGLKARTDLYALRSQKQFNQPLICTHAGLTGIRMADRLQYLQQTPVAKGEVWEIRHLKKTGHLPFSAFNLCSINLYDEDVLQVLESGGLIGISLDQRIIGYPTEHIAYRWNGYPYDHEHISRFETEVFFGTPYPVQLMLQPPADVLTGDDALGQEPISELAHAYYFMNQVIHVLKVAVANGISYNKAKKMICIGSDFDGLINAIDCCKDATQFDAFKQLLNGIARKPDFWSNTGFGPNEVDIDELLDLIFYRNGVNFIKQHLR